MKFLSILMICFFSLQTLGFDKYNTYQWNRRNALAENGKVNKSPWYEWWYYKVVLPETGESFFFVYGIVNPWDVNKTMKGTRSYVGMGDFKAKLQVEKHLNISDFSAAYDRTYVEVDGHVATDKRFYADIVNETGDKFSWDIKIQKKWAFNAEGWMMGTGLTDIEWYPAQADARCSGSVLAKGRLIKFKDAPCYQDRNWGTKFPKWWTWIVSNHFENSPTTALAIGGGKPTIVRSGKAPIKGITVGLKHKGIEYTFRPIDLFNVVMSDIEFGKWEVVAYNKTHKVKVIASAPKKDFMDLQFMTPAGDIFHDYETLTGKLLVRLYRRTLKGWKLMDTMRSNQAGIEFGSK